MEESDRKRMLYWACDGAAKHQIILFVVGLIFAICGLAHIGIATYTAHFRGENLFNVFQHLATRVDFDKTYSGSYLISVNELSNGLLCLILPCCFFVNISVRRREREHVRRLIKVLKKSGGWQ